MAEKNIEMKRKNADGSYDTYFPRTKAVNVLATDGADLESKLANYNQYKSGKDANGIYTVIDYKRSNGTLYMKSTLSGGTSPNYTTATEQYYDAAGTTVIKTATWVLTYDSEGVVYQKVVS